MSKVCSRGTTCIPKVLAVMCTLAGSLIVVETLEGSHWQTRETTSKREPATRITFLNRNTLLHGVQPGAIYLISEKQLVLLWHNLEARCGSLTCSRAGHVLWALAWRPWLLRLWQQPDWAPLLFLSFFFFLSFFPSIFILGHCAKPLTWSRVQQLYLLCLRRCQ